MELKLWEMAYIEGLGGVVVSYICDKGNRKNKGVGEGWMRV